MPLFGLFRERKESTNVTLSTILWRELEGLCPSDSDVTYDTDCLPSIELPSVLPASCPVLHRPFFLLALTSSYSAVDATLLILDKRSLCHVHKEMRRTAGNQDWRRSIH